MFAEEQKLELSPKGGFTETVRLRWFDSILDYMEQL
jgi:hypothetical protein